MCWFQTCCVLCYSAVGITPSTSRWFTQNKSTQPNIIITQSKFSHCCHHHDIEGIHMHRCVALALTAMLAESHLVIIILSLSMKSLCKWERCILNICGFRNGISHNWSTWSDKLPNVQPCSKACTVYGLSIFCGPLWLFPFVNLLELVQLTFRYMLVNIVSQIYIN